MKKILITIVLITASTFLYSQSMDLNHKKIHIVDSTMGLGISPTSRLHVFGNGTTSNLLNVTNDKDATKDSSVIIDAVGNVGIGKTPTSKLEVVDGTNTYIGSAPLAIARTMTNNKIAFIGSAVTNFSEEYPAYNIGLYGTAMGGTNNFAGYFGNGNVYVQEKVGIGRLAPTYRFEVFGNGDDGATDLLKVSNDINSTYDSTFVVNKVGKVGIGTTTPKDYLDINGNITFPNNKYIFWNAYNKGDTIYQREPFTCVLMYQKTGDANKLFNIDIGKDDSFQNDVPLLWRTGVLSVRTNAEINIYEEIMWRDSLGDYKKGTTLSDNEAYELPTFHSWKGEIDVDSLGYTLFTAQIRCDANGTPYLEGVSWKRWSSKTYVEVGSTDGYLNITDGGSGMVITNRLGYTIKATLRFRTKQ